MATKKAARKPKRKAARRPQSRAVIQKVLDGMAKLSAYLAETPEFEISPSALARLPKRERAYVQAARATSIYIFDLIGEALRAYERSRRVLEAKLRR